VFGPVSVKTTVWGSAAVKDAMSAIASAAPLI